MSNLSADTVVRTSSTAVSSKRKAPEADADVAVQQEQPETESAIWKCLLCDTNDVATRAPHPQRSEDMYMCGDCAEEICMHCATLIRAGPLYLFSAQLQLTTSESIIEL